MSRAAHDLCGDHGGRRKDGRPCGGDVVRGTTRCYLHAGKRKAKAKAQGAVVLELRRWGLDGQTELVDPNVTMLKLVTQSAHRVDLLSSKLAEAYEAAERLKTAHEALGLLVADEGEDERAAVLQARADLERVFNTGGVSVFVGLTYSATKDGDLYATGEAIRGLARAEAEERERCASFAAKAIAAGLGERMVHLAERQGAQMYAVFGRVLEGLGLTQEQAAAVPALLEREVRALMSGPPTIEGSAT